eukprot:2818581-Heterocapsa_arctica.AAC.1
MLLYIYCLLYVIWAGLDAWLAAWLDVWLAEGKLASAPHPSRQSDCNLVFEARIPQLRSRGAGVA